MVFDFFKKRAEEGVQQISNLATTNDLSKALLDAADYTRRTNQAFADGLTKSRNRLLNELESIFGGDRGDLLEELEDVLIGADLGLDMTEEVIREIRSLREDSLDWLTREDVISILRGKLIESLDTAASSSYGGGEEEKDADAIGKRSRSIQFASTATAATTTTTTTTTTTPPPLTVLFIMGANGAGKTTTIGKLSHRLRTEGEQKVLLAACDTFRAGAVDQLRLWSERSEVDFRCSKGDSEKSPSSVLYGALEDAIQGGYDTLIVDTSGRLSNNDALTRELKKMKMVIQKKMSVENEDGKPVLNRMVPHETLLVIDAAQGRMALESAKVWDEEIGLSGLILTKLDGSAKGGSIVAVSKELGLPVKLVGVGEGIDDLRDFDPETFVDSLLGIGDAGGGADSSGGAITKEEARALDDRLAQMRKARDERAKQVNQQTKSGSLPTNPFGSVGPAGEMTFQEMDPAAASADGNVAVSKPNNKNKNKKKKKKKKRRGN